MNKTLKRSAGMSIVGVLVSSVTLITFVLISIQFMSAGVSGIKHATLKGQLEDIREIVRSEFDCVKTVEASGSLCDGATADPLPQIPLLRSDNSQLIGTSASGDPIGKFYVRAHCKKHLNNIQVEISVRRDSSRPENALPGTVAKNWIDLFEGIPVLCKRTIAASAPLCEKYRVVATPASYSTQINACRLLGSQWKLARLDNSAEATEMYDFLNSSGNLPPSSASVADVRQPYISNDCKDVAPRTDWSGYVYTGNLSCSSSRTIISKNSMSPSCNNKICFTDVAATGSFHALCENRDCTPEPASSCLTPSPPSIANTRGYVSRACGFDMNRNGIVGEPADCQVCDGVTSDPDGDGISENLIYISNVGIVGVDNGACGSAAAPCQTINYAMSNRLSASSTTQDVLCVHGTFNERVTLRKGGVPNSYTRDSFSFPRDPLMIVGWDYNRNGQYPPFDSADVAVIDGAAPTPSGYAFDNLTNHTSYLEIAHLTVRNFKTGNSGFLTLNSAFEKRELYIHDTQLLAVTDQMGVGAPNNANVSIFFDNVGFTRNLAFVNNSVLDFNGRILMANSPHAGINSVRIQNNSFRLRASNNSQLWGSLGGVGVSDVEFIHNTYDGNTSAWSPAGNGFDGNRDTVNPIWLDSCSTRWTVRGNDFNDVMGILIASPKSGCNNLVPQDRIILDRNSMKSIPNSSGELALIYDAREAGAINSLWTAQNSTWDLCLTNNIMFPKSGYLSQCFIVGSGNESGPQPGKTYITGNTCYGPIQREGVKINSGPIYPTDNYIITNNIFVTNGDFFLHLNPNLSELISDGNLFVRTGGSSSNFYLGGTNYSTFANWQSGTGLDSNSFWGCMPSFINTVLFDFHLHPGDTCARDRGINMSPILGFDFDGQMRPNGPFNIGADE